MNVELPQYPNYNQCESEWLGQIPSGWTAIRLSRLNTKLTNGFVGPTRDILTDNGVRYIQSLHIKAGEIVFDTPYFVSEKWSNAHSKSILNTGDVLIVQTGDIGQVAAVTDEFASCNCHALIIVSSKKKFIYGSFLSAVLRSHYGFHSLKSVQTGALHPHLNCTVVRDLFVPVPPLPEQQSILAFLDRETIKIDRLIKARRKQVELLEEQRRIVIHEAVTKGINPTGWPMKVSGVAWLGDIPAHWKVKRLKFLVSHNQETLSEKTPGDYIIDYIDIGNVDSRGRITEIESLEFDNAPSRARRKVKMGSTIISTVRTYLRAITNFPDPVNNTIVSTGFAVLDPKRSLNAKFLYYSISSEYFIQKVISESKGVSYPAINSNDLVQITICYPKVDEQVLIVQFIDREIAKIDLLVSKYMRELELLAEYRASLISHVVTGKIDVRSLARPRQPEMAVI